MGSIEQETTPGRKILYVSSALIPSSTAISINIMKSCHAMAALGHEVVLLAPGINSPEIMADVDAPFEVELIVELASLSRGHDFHTFGGTSEELAHWQKRYSLDNSSAFTASLPRCAASIPGCSRHLPSALSEKSRQSGAFDLRLPAQAF